MTEKRPYQYLIDALRVLPGVGNKSAQRLAFTLLHERRRSNWLPPSPTLWRICVIASGHYTLSDDVGAAPEANPRRQRELLCVVQSPMDQLLIRQTMTYKGLYFVLIGHLKSVSKASALKAIAMDQLIQRACDGVVQE